MTQPRTNLDYSRRIERVVQHIGAHLDAALDLAALAEIASFSPYHFHRIYRSVTGETVADTVRRERLHRAAGDLVRGKGAIARIAKTAGYGSVAAFTRAFAAAYGIPPAQYRRQGRLLSPARETGNEEHAMYSVELRQIGPLRLAAFDHAGSYMEIGPVFERLFAWAGGRGLLRPDTRMIGLYYDDPAAVPVAKLRSKAAVTLPDGQTPDGGAQVVELPGGRHAVTRHKGPYAELEMAYGWLYREWLPTSGQEPADWPIFEEYLNNPRTVPPAEWLTDICMPLKEPSAFSDQPKSG
jgi:AraC family transcriptional regulator